MSNRLQDGAISGLLAFLVFACSPVAQGQLSIWAVTGQPAPDGGVFVRLHPSSSSGGPETPLNYPPVVSNLLQVGYVATRAVDGGNTLLEGIYVDGGREWESGAMVRYSPGGICDETDAVVHHFLNLGISDHDVGWYSFEAIVERAIHTQNCDFEGAHVILQRTDLPLSDWLMTEVGVGYGLDGVTIAAGGILEFAPGRFEVLFSNDQFGVGDSTHAYQSGMDTVAISPLIQRHIWGRYLSKASVLPCRKVLWASGSAASALNSNDGTICFVGKIQTLDDTSSFLAVLVAHPVVNGVIPSCESGEETVELLAQANTPAPGTSHCFDNENPFPWGAVGNSSGTVVFGGSLYGGGECESTNPDTVSSAGIWVAPPNPENPSFPPGLQYVRLAVRGGDAAEGIEGAYFSNLSLVGNPLVLNDRNELLFVAGLGYESPTTGPSAALYRVSMEFAEDDATVVREPLVAVGQTIMGHD